MNNSKLKFSNNSINKKTDWNIDTIGNEIFHDLNGSVNISVIQETLKGIIPRYENARIQTYIPILIRREAEKLLQAMQDPLATPFIEINESETWIDHSDNRVNDR